MNNTIGDTLRTLRTRKNYTMEQLAGKIGVARQSVAKWENNESLPDLLKCKALAELYGVTIDAIVNSSIDEIEQPKNSERFIFGFVRVGARGQVVLPKKARDFFKINSGDNMLVLGDKSKQGIAVVKVDLIDDIVKLT